YIKRYPILDQCDQVALANHKWYTHTLNAGPNQIYEFDIRHQSPSGSVILNVADSKIPVRGTCTMLDEHFCRSATREPCNYKYRRAGIPQISVYGDGGSVAVHNYNV